MSFCTAPGPLLVCTGVLQSMVNVHCTHVHMYTVHCTVDTSWWPATLHIGHCGQYLFHRNPSTLISLADNQNRLPVQWWKLFLKYIQRCFLSLVSKQKRRCKWWELKARAVKIFTGSWWKPVERWGKIFFGGMLFPRLNWYDCKQSNNAQASWGRRFGNDGTTLQATKFMKMATNHCWKNYDNDKSLLKTERRATKIGRHLWQWTRGAIFLVNI